MKVMNSSYNVLTIDIGTIVEDTKTLVGTVADFRMIKRCTAKSGIIKVKMTMGGNTMIGTCEVNPWATEDKLECTSLTMFGGTLQAVVATVECDSDGCKVTVGLETV